MRENIWEGAKKIGRFTRECLFAVVRRASGACQYLNNPEYLRPRRRNTWSSVNVNAPQCSEIRALNGHWRGGGCGKAASRVYSMTRGGAAW